MSWMTPNRSISVLAISAFTVLALAGCAAEEPAPAPSTSATPEVSPTTSAEPVAQKPPIIELVLTTEGLGSGDPSDLVFGATPSTSDPVSDLVTFSPDACAGTGASDPALWLANYPETDEGFGPQAPFAIAVVDNLLKRIDVNTTNIITDEGLALGSSLDAVLGIYPGGPDEVVNHADVSDVYVFLGEKGKLMFEVAVDRIPGYWAPDQLDTVVFLSAVSIDTAPYGVAASDNVVGVCNVS